MIEGFLHLGGRFGLALFEEVPHALQVGHEAVFAYSEIDLQRMTAFRPAFAGRAMAGRGVGMRIHDRAEIHLPGGGQFTIGQAIVHEVTDVDLAQAGPQEAVHFAEDIQRRFDRRLARVPLRPSICGHAARR